MVLKYLFIFTGLILVAFSSIIIEWVEDYTVNVRNGDLPKLLTQRRIMVSGLALISWGVYEIVALV